MGRLSTSSSTSSASSTYSDSTTCSDTKDTTTAPPPPRKSLRQKARNVISDLGSPPTRRQDLKDGRSTQYYAETGMLGSGIGRPARM